MSPKTLAKTLAKNLAGHPAQKHFELRVISVTIFSFWGGAKSPALFLRLAQARNTSSLYQGGPMPTLKYKRVLLKLSGEALAGENKTGIDPATVATICREIGTVLEMGVEMALVIGGGNIFRGLSGSAKGMERSSADYMGMLATVLNALAVQDMLEKLGYPTRVLSAITMQEVCEPFIRRRALRHMEKGRVVICAAGTGNPYFTTDTTAALRGMELKCDAIIKATKVDGIYDKDPAKFADAVKYDSITYDETLARHLGVMDATAFALVRDNNVPIIVCRMFGGDIGRVVTGEAVGTIVQN